MKKVFEILKARGEGVKNFAPPPKSLGSQKYPRRDFWWEQTYPTLRESGLEAQTSRRKVIRIDLKVQRVPQLHSVLGRQLVHDPRSKDFPAVSAIDKSTWRSKTIRIYDPRINPNQCHGECTGVAKCVTFNAVGNRVSGVVLDMDDAHNFYHTATTLDPWPGEWPPEDTGSSGLASAKAAQKLGLGGAYRHVFNGADEVVQLIMDGHAVSCGTWWYEDMFNPSSKGVISPTGKQVGGHQYTARGYDLGLDHVIIRCWWGSYRDVRIAREHLNELIMDGGDAHIQERIKN